MKSVLSGVRRFAFSVKKGAVEDFVAPFQGARLSQSSRVLFSGLWAKFSDAMITRTVKKGYHFLEVNAAFLFNNVDNFFLSPFPYLIYF